ncbi:hypothetical protein CR513_55446, partial [Mucuna pruriens]
MALFKSTSALVATTLVRAPSSVPVPFIANRITFSKYFSGRIKHFTVDLSKDRNSSFGSSFRSCSIAPECASNFCLGFCQGQVYLISFISMRTNQSNKVMIENQHLTEVPCCVMSNILLKRLLIKHMVSLPRRKQLFGGPTAGYFHQNPIA